MTPDAITLLFKEARDTFPPIEGKPMDDNLQLIRKKLLPILMEIPYDQLGGTHSLVGILTDAKRYAANHGGTTFVCPLCLPLYDATIVASPCLACQTAFCHPDAPSRESSEC
jgi:hypothetical protein